MTQKNTPTRRDRQVKIDATVDFLCVAIPLCVMWFAYQVPISASPQQPPSPAPSIHIRNLNTLAINRHAVMNLTADFKYV